MSKRADALQIRPAAPGERDDLEALQRRSSTALDDYRQQLEAHPDAIHLPIELIERGQVIVAETEAGIVGFAAVVEGQECAELDGLFVEPGHWRRGAGAALVEAATHHARRRGLSLTVVASPSARRFYERCGFSVEGETKTRFGPAIRMSR